MKDFKDLKLTYIHHERIQQDENVIEKLKEEVLRTRMSRKILKEIIINFIFIGILFTFIYSTKNINSFSYSNHLERSFSGYQRVIIIFLFNFNLFFYFFFVFS